MYYTRKAPALNKLTEEFLWVYERELYIVQFSNSFLICTLITNSFLIFLPYAFGSLA